MVAKSDNGGARRESRGFNDLAAEKARLELKVLHAEMAAGEAWGEQTADVIERMEAGGSSARRGTHMRGAEAVELGLADEVGISATVTAAHMERVAALALNQKPDGDDSPAPTLTVFPPLADRVAYKPPTPDLAGLLTKHGITAGG